MSSHHTFRGQPVVLGFSYVSKFDGRVMVEINPVPGRGIDETGAYGGITYRDLIVTTTSNSQGEQA